jgi:hypothetical protein
MAMRDTTIASEGAGHFRAFLSLVMGPRGMQQWRCVVARPKIRHLLLLVTLDFLWSKHLKANGQFCPKQYMALKWILQTYDLVALDCVLRKTDLMQRFA